MINDNQQENDNDMLLINILYIITSFVFKIILN